MVKKAGQAVPNQLLRRARLERGWTQKVVAERIGAPNDIMVTRWERGKAFPSAYYAERLCQLFGQKASDLGLLRELYITAAPQPLAPLQFQPDLSNDQKKDGFLTMSFSRQNIPPFSSLPLIGRVTATHQLQTLYQHVQQGRMQVALIQGDAGIGKTHLALAFLQWAIKQGATLLQGRAFEMGGRLPYQPLVYALGRRLQQEASPEALLNVTWLSELSRVLPELRERYPSLPVATEDEMTARIRLFEAITHLGQAFCVRSPAILFIDDIQWADTASLDVLHYAGQRWSESGVPLLLLLAVRSEALATSAPLRTWLASLHRDLPVTELSLGPLTLEETLQLIATLETDQAMDIERFADIGQRLFQETRGQPFYLVETLKALFARQILTLQRFPDGERLALDLTSLETVPLDDWLPPGVRRLILSQLEQLTPTGRILLNASAILGQGSSFEMLCRVGNLEERDALVALEEILRHGLLREAGDEERRERHASGESYIFAHDKIREAVTTEMGEAQRFLLHRRAFAVLQTPGRPAAELAHHALGARLTEQAFHLSLVAGNEAGHLLASKEAYLHYSQALEVLSQFPETTDTRGLRIETLLKLVQVSWVMVRVEQTLERLAEAEGLAQALFDQRQLFHIHYWLGVVYGIRNAMRQARTYTEQVLREAQELDEEELVALASVQLSRVLMLQGQYEPIEPLLTPILPALERMGNWLDWTYALGNLGGALAQRGQVALGVAQGQRPVEHARQAGELKGERGIMARHQLSAIYLYGGDFPQMLEINAQIIEEAQQWQNWLLVYWACGYRAWALGRLGRHAEALETMARAQEAGQRLGEHIMGQDVLEAITAELLLSAGQVEEALACAQITVELAQNEVDGLLSSGIAERVWGQALARQARWEEVEKHLAASWRILLSGEILLEAARTQVAWGLLCRDSDDRTSAQAHFEQAIAQFEVSGLAYELEEVRGYLALLWQS